LELHPCHGWNAIVCQARSHLCLVGGLALRALGYKGVTPLKPPSRFGGRQQATQRAPTSRAGCRSRGAMWASGLAGIGEVGVRGPEGYVLRWKRLEHDSGRAADEVCLGIARDGVCRSRRKGQVHLAVVADLLGKNRPESVHPLSVRALRGYDRWASDGTAIPDYRHAPPERRLLQIDAVDGALVYQLGAGHA